MTPTPSELDYFLQGCVLGGVIMGFLTTILTIIQWNDAKGDIEPEDWRNR